MKVIVSIEEGNEFSYIKQNFLLLYTIT